MPNLAMDVSKKEIVFFADATKKHYSVENSFEAIQSFLKENFVNPQNTLIGCESTADFHMQPCIAALKLGFNVKVLNPILTKRIINATVRKKKTDYSDAEIIAKLLADHHGNEVTLASFNNEKRTMLRTEQALTKCAADLKKIAGSLKIKAKSMDVSSAMEAIINSIEALEEEAKKLTSEATEEQNRQEELLDSIPGFGKKLSAIISAESGDIKRFPSANQYKAYVGIDPQVKQSGNSLHTGHITKRGNPILRYALYLAANVARIHDPDMKAFYEKKRGEGKSYRHVVCAVSRKLCERIYAVVTKDEYYRVNKL